MPTRTTSTRRRIVVGVDGSAPSLRALEWAARQADLTDSMVEIVMSWEPPLVHGWVPPVRENGHIKEKLRRSLDAIVAKLLAEHPALVVETKFVEGHPAPLLIEASRGAEVLVVGCRGHGAFVGMLVGSVSEHCVAQAKCPVLVYRPGS